jgi:homopolymeric O-antigen transport system ATP-binding protein
LNTVIKVESVSKKFCRKLNHVMVYGVHDIARNMLGLSSRSEKLRDGEFWALQNVAFEVKKGEVLGIIGPNGSGKSTLLKLLNGIFMPDRGKIEITGNVGALIEVGAGFHPMLSGRENVYVNGAILGMGKREIDEKFDAIIDFADIGEFIDAPVKHYSSGMYVRLGFSIAVHAEPDILIVDEVLAVGDINFQIKCFRKIAEFKEQGKTIIIVTHDMTAIQRHAERVLLLNKGNLIADDTPEKIVGRYLSLVTNDSTDDMQGATGSQKATTDVECNMQEVFVNEASKEDVCHDNEGYNNGEFRYGNGGARILDYELLNTEGKKISRIKSGDPIIFRLKVKFFSDVKLHIHGLKITAKNGLEIVNDNTLHYKELDIKPQKMGDVLWVEHTVNIDLSPGDYIFSVGVATIDEGEVVPLDRRYDLVFMSVVEGDGDIKKSNIKSGIQIFY